ncbi:MAG: hypothetical protein GVY19_08055 [Bacteroidetes bacterium]|jgi:hypothetical protein|nr:hypothetical protein [Bacteroidota bacterium]
MKNISSITSTNPFPGLRPFGLNESHYFFGRKGQSSAVLELLLQNRFVAVTGASGSGKSSLIYCGVIPALFGGYSKEISSNWKIITTRPGNSPIKNLSRALLDVDESLQDQPGINQKIIHALLNRSSRGLIDQLKQSAHLQKYNHLLIIDQFEELFRYNESRAPETLKEETEAFIKLIVNTIQATEVPVYIIITIRSDFIGECSAYTEFTKYINDSNFLIPKMKRQDYKEAIVGPIAVSGASIEPQLVEKVLNSLTDNSDQLPVMQHALMRTWDVWKDKNTLDKPISVTDFDSAGTLERAISLHANEAYETLSADQKKTCKRVFQTLAVKGAGNRGIRQPAQVNYLAAVCNKSEQDIIDVVNVFRTKERSFLTPGQDVPLNSNSVIDLSHESLMRVWDKLRAWVDEEVASVQMYMRLVEASDLYQKGKGGLWKPPDLHLALNWRKTQQPTLAWAGKHHPAFERVKVFIDASERQFLKEESHKVRLQRRALKRSRAFALVLGVFAITFMSMMFYAYNQKAEADKARKIAEELRQKAEGQKDLEMEKRLQFENLAIMTADSLEKQKKASIEKSKLYENEIQEAKEDVNEVIKEKEEIYERTLIVEQEKEQAEQTAKQAQQMATAAEQDKQQAYQKRLLSIAQSLAVKSQQVTDDNLSALLSFQAYIFNQRYNGVDHNPDVYNSLYDAKSGLMGHDYNGLEGHRGAVRAIEFVPDSEEFYSIGTDGRILQWDLRSSNKAQLLHKNNFINRSLAISPDGKYLACGNDQSTIQLFNLQNPGAAPKILSAHNGWVWALSFSRDGSQLISTGADMRLILWNINDLSHQVVAEHDSRIRSLTFARSGNEFYTADDNGNLLQWDVNGNNSSLLQNNHSIYSISLNSSGRYIAIGDKEGNLKIVNTQTKTVVNQVQAHNARIFDVQFSPQNTFMATSSLDGTIKIWRTSNLQARPIHITRHESWVLSVAFSQNENYLVSSSNKGDLIYVWPTKIDLLANNMCSILNRNLSNSEWNTYIGNDIPYEATCEQLANN